MKLRHVLTFFAAVLLPLTASAADSRSRPNIIFILIDDLRWDEVDYPFVKVPNIQRIAREGVRFQNSVHHYASLLAEPCKLSHRSIRAQTWHHRQHGPQPAQSRTCHFPAPPTRRWLRDRFSGQMAHGPRRQSTTRH